MISKDYPLSVMVLTYFFSICFGVLMAVSHAVDGGGSTFSGIMVGQFTGALCLWLFPGFLVNRNQGIKA